MSRRRPDAIMIDVRRWPQRGVILLSNCCIDRSRSYQTQPSDDPEMVRAGPRHPRACMDFPMLRRLNEDVVDPPEGGDRGPGSALLVRTVGRRPGVDPCPPVL